MAYNLDDYVDVAERIQRFHEKYPDGSLQSEWGLHEINGAQTLVVRGYAYRTPDDPRPGIGHATEPVPGLTNFSKNSELMVGETSAWGRALAALGFEVKRGIASREEVRNRQEVDGGGVSQTGTSTATIGFVSEKQKGFYERLAREKLPFAEIPNTTRYLEQAPRQVVSGAIDSLKDGGSWLEGLRREVDAWARQQTDLPFTEEITQPELEGT